MLVREGGLSSDENNPLLVATAKAFELLEIASYGRRGLKNKGNYAAGLAEFVESKKARERLVEAVEKIPKWEWKYDEHGKKLPVPFEEGLALLIPKPGVKASKTADRRIARLKAFMIDRYQAARPEQDERERMIEVEDRIAAMKKDGIPPHLFDQWLVLFPEWWQRKASETRSAVGQRGQQAKTEKKGNQGRVKSKDNKQRRTPGSIAARRKNHLTDFRRDFAFGHRAMRILLPAPSQGDGFC